MRRQVMSMRRLPEAGGGNCEFDLVAAQALQAWRDHGTARWRDMPMHVAFLGNIEPEEQIVLDLLSADEQLGRWLVRIARRRHGPHHGRVSQLDHDDLRLFDPKSES